MPLTLAAATLLAGGLGVAGAGGQAFATGRMNKKTRAWNEMMYERQKADNQAYNDPAAQMARMKAAGLNPHLVYGNMSTASPVAPATAPKWDPEVPNIAGIGNAAANTIAAYQSAQQAQSSMDVQAQQLENMKTANQLQMLDGIQKMLNIDSKQFTNSRQLEMYNYSLDTMKSKLKNIDSDTYSKDINTHIALAENDRKDLKNIREQKELDLKIEELAMKQANSKEQRAMVGVAMQKMRTEIDLNKQEYKDRNNALNAQSSYAERQIMQSGSETEKFIWSLIKELIKAAK